MAMMSFKAFTFLSLLASVTAVTKVAVLELGTKGAVRRTTSDRRLVSVNGLSSLVQQGPPSEAGLPVVSDLFQKAHKSLVIGLINKESVDLTKVISHVETAVGDFEVDGTLNQVMSRLPLTDLVEVDSFDKVTKNQMQASSVSGVTMVVNTENAQSVDEAISNLLSNLKSQYEAQGQTIIVHIIMQDDTKATMHRRLDQAQYNNAYEDDNYNNNNNNNNGQNQYKGYYGYGYYNAYGEWVTPYKTMFQIQYFNVVLWTSVGLTLTLFFTIYIMMYMPLEPDTLLFGESAKLIGDD